MCQVSHISFIYHESNNESLGSPFKVEIFNDLKDQMPNTIIKSTDEKTDKRMSGGLVGSLNVLEFDGTNCDGKIEAIISGRYQNLQVYKIIVKR